MKIPEPDEIPQKGFYYHYKHDPNGPVGNYAYEVIGVGCHTEDNCRPEDANMVVYRPLYPSASVYRANRLFDLRPLKMFTEQVMGAISMPRFQLITDPDIISQLHRIRKEMYGE